MMRCALLDKNTYLSSHQTRTYVWKFGACTFVQCCELYFVSRFSELRNKCQFSFPDAVLYFDQCCESAGVVSFEEFRRNCF